MKQTFIVQSSDDGVRLDVYLASVSDMSRSQVKKMVEIGQILLNNEPPKKAGVIVREGNIIDIIQQKEDADQKEVKIDWAKYDIRIIAKKDEYLVVYKPAGILVHQTQAGEPETLSAWLVEKYPDIVGVGESDVRPGIVHRLDKDASGLLVIARTQKMFEHLKKQFQDRNVKKIYSVLVYGNFDVDHDVIDFDIDRGKDGRMVSRPKTNKLKLKNADKIMKGKKSLTEYWVEEKFIRFSLIRVQIHSGRTHQIRVHMYATGHPVVGDKLYFNKKLIKKQDRLSRLFLHAKELTFIDLNENEVSFDVDVPLELQTFLLSLT